MKTQINISGEIYEVEIKAKNLTNSKVSTKSTNMVTRWLEARLWDAAHSNDQNPDLAIEIRNAAAKLYRYNLLNNHTL